MIAGKRSVPASSISYRRCTPVVVSSETPRTVEARRSHLPGSSERVVRSNWRMTPHSAGSESASNTGTLAAEPYSEPLCKSSVASPPSSTIRSGPEPSGQVSIWSVHHQYSWSVSPFQAKTGTPLGASGVPPRPTTIAAAAWSCVEKMLQEAHRTSAPRSTRVSMSTAVCTVICREPATLSPASDCFGPYSARAAMRPGISCSASRISLRPHSARETSFTLKARLTALSFWSDRTAISVMDSSQLGR